MTRNHRDGKPSKRIRCGRGSYSIKGLNASNLNVTGFSITDDSLVTLSDGSKKKIKDVKAGEEVLTLEEKTGKLVPRKVNALRDHGVKLTYELATKTGRAINTTAEHPYFVKVDSDRLGIGDVSESSSSKVIKYPSKSAGFDFFLSNLENAEISASGLSCGNFNNTTENIFSLGNFEESVKCRSLVINTLCSDLENSASFPFESPFGLDIMSNPCCVRNTSSLFFTFSSLRNLTCERDTNGDIISSSRQVSSILKGCLDMLFSNSWMVIEDFVNAHSSMEHFQNLPDHYPGACKGRSSAANFAVRNNIFVDFNSHNTINNDEVFKPYDENGEFTNAQWIEVRYLKVGDEIAVPDYSTGTIKWEKIASIKALEPQHVYDLSIEGTRNFIANDIVAHNTYLATSGVGNVGINTTSPAQTLTVQGTLNVSNPGTTGQLFMDSSGNLGSGTSPDDSASSPDAAIAQNNLINETNNNATSVTETEEKEYNKEEVKAIQISENKFTINSIDEEEIIEKIQEKTKLDTSKSKICCAENPKGFSCKDKIKRAIKFKKKEPVKDEFEEEEIEEETQPTAPSIVQLGYIEKVNGSVIIRLG